MTDLVTGTILEPAQSNRGESVEFTTSWSSGTQGTRASSVESVSGIGFSNVGRGDLQKSKRQVLGGNPTRRLRGFVIAMRENQARVGFVQEDKSVVEYLLPEKNLRKAGITAINQPFEMDEIEYKTGDGFLSGYVFRPMAPADAVVTDSFDIDDELTELRNAALRHYGRKADD